MAVVAPFTAEGLFTSSQTPAVLSDPDPAQVNLGVKFVASEAGSIAGLEYYRGTGDTGTHTGSLWSSTGQLLATATFAAETASGWQTVYFSSPVTIAPNTTYVASYHSNGHYAATGDYFGAIYDPNGSLATSGPAAGVYTYGAGNLFPTSTSNANYWVDVLFVSSGAPIAVNDSGFTTPQGTALDDLCYDAARKRQGSEQRSALDRRCRARRWWHPHLQCPDWHGDVHAEYWLHRGRDLHLPDYGRHQRSGVGLRQPHCPAAFLDPAVVRLLGHAGNPFRSRSEQRQPRREVPRHRGGRDHGSQVLQGGGRHRHSRRVVVDQRRDPSR